jgi:hypothetical protein
MSRLYAPGSVLVVDEHGHHRDPVQEKARRDLAASVLRGLRPCVGYRPASFYPDHIFEIVYRLEQLKRRRWTSAGIRRYWDREQEARELGKHRDAMIAVLVKRREHERNPVRRTFLAMAITELKAVESGVYWAPGFFGEGRPRKPYALTARLLGGLVLRALRGADRLSGRGIGLDGAVSPQGPLRSRLSGGSNSPVVRLICEWLDCIYPTPADPDNVLKILQTIKAVESPEDYGDRERP